MRRITLIRIWRHIKPTIIIIIIIIIIIKTKQVFQGLQSSALFMLFVLNIDTHSMYVMCGILCVYIDLVYIC